MTKTATAVELVPTWKQPAEPSWDRARELAKGIRHVVDDVISLGLELTALRQQFIAQGKGGGRYANSNFVKGVNEVISDMPRGSRETDEQFAERGWQAKVKEELNVSHVTALELMKRARYCCMLRDVSVGKDVRYLDSKKEIREVTAAPELRQLATQALGEIATGQASPARAWAGVSGEGQRREKGIVPKRDEINHAKNVMKALKALRTSLRHWNKFQPGERAQCECLWDDVFKYVPGTWMK